MKSKNIVGENIRKFRLSAGLTQEALANRSGLSQGYINQLENGKRNFTQKSLERIAGELQMDMYRLLMDGEVADVTLLVDESVFFCEFKKDCDLYTNEGKHTIPTLEGFITLLEKLPKEILGRYYKLLVFEKHGVKEG
ncbi:MAG: helix-turn-helix transcriptional regulator [Deltaproteobacteria bacterium]|nr:helix-turn-helix transcriptional regulator [Deltaproteobacteria bacterium]